MAIISISDSQKNSANGVLVADASSKIPAINGSQITILSATNVSSGTIATALLDTGLTANKIVLVDGSGNLPVVDGSQLTGIVSLTLSASDPTISTNPSGGLGTEWNNSTSGEMYICTDATAGANVWTNVGAGTDNIAPVPMWQGTQYGYSAGGFTQPPAYQILNRIERFSFTTDGNAVDVGDVAKTNGSPGGSAAHGGASSKTHGYIAGGTGGANSSPAWGYFTDIEKWAFASATTNATKIGDRFGVGQCVGHMSDTHGYCSTDGTGPAPSNSTIDKYTFAADNNATDVGGLVYPRYGVTGTSSTTHGYTCGGSDGPGNKYNYIQKFSFASDGDATDSGNLVDTHYEGAGNGSETHSYISGGYNSSAKVNVIQKFSTAADSNATDVADMTQAMWGGRGTSSTTYGYMIGGRLNGGYTDRIEKFNFATELNATDVGNLAQQTQSSSGVSY